MIGVRSLGRLSGVALAGLTVAAPEPGLADDAPLPTGVFVVTDELIEGRLRIFGKAGDLALRNQSVTAIVRKSDGWLVDFWPNDERAPTEPQLGTLSSVDGLWVLHPVLFDGMATIHPTAREVRAAGNVVEAVADLPLGAGTVEVITSYELEGEAARLLVTTRFVHKHGGKVSHVSLGDEVKWGNVDYYVEGHGLTPEHFSGNARWVGRRGAGGDLMLETLEPRPMQVAYRSLQRGQASSIVTGYLGGSINPGRSLTVRRALAYAPIDAAPPRVVPSGTLEIHIADEAGSPLASKIGLRGTQGTLDPNFGNDGDETGANRFVWSGNGSFQRKLAAGSYRIVATAGIERDWKTWSVVVEDGKTTALDAQLPRVVTTPGWISADLHLHTAPSPDADIACSTRVISIAAEGVELAAATDHYTSFDLGPATRALLESGALTTRVVTMVGTEVSTVGNRFGHFNLFPVAPDTVVPYENTTPKQLFADMRAASPEGVLQVNHPRLDQLGYFHRYRVDPATGKVPAASRGEFDESYDALEVFNGFDVVSQPKLRHSLYDWIHLLGRGFRYAATGNSDSHKLFFVDPGVVRNMIHYGDAASDAADLDVDEKSVVSAIKRGHVVVTTGPILEADILGKGPGETVSGAGKHLPLHIRVRAAPFVDVTDVEVLLGEKGRRVRFIATKGATGVTRLDTTVELVVDGKSFVVVVARGQKDMPNTFSPGIRPIAFTNPIWIEP